MINLEKNSGLPIELENDLRIKFNPPLSDREPTFVREFSQVIPYLQNPKSQAPVAAPYLGYRNIHLPGDLDFTESNHLQYDLTIMAPIMVGQEFNKTIGHYHDLIPGTTIAHPELYEILNGQGIILMQKMDAEYKELIAVICLEVKKGDKIVYPPNYGHILVNTGNEPLVTANWLSTDYKPLYEPVKEKQGMAYYVVEGENGEPKFVKNENYKNHPQIRKVAQPLSLLKDFGLLADEPMYPTAVKNPKSVEFLNQPQKYAVELSAASS